MLIVMLTKYLTSQSDNEAKRIAIKEAKIRNEQILAISQSMAAMHQAGMQPPTEMTARLRCLLLAIPTQSASSSVCSTSSLSPAAHLTSISQVNPLHAFAQTSLGQLNALNSMGQTNQIHSSGTINAMNQLNVLSQATQASQSNSAANAFQQASQINAMGANQIPILSSMIVTNSASQSGHSTCVATVSQPGAAGQI
jgi:hypothetical protein